MSPSSSLPCHNAPHRQPSWPSCCHICYNAPPSPPFARTTQSLKSYNGFRAVNAVKPAMVTMPTKSSRGTLQIMAARVGGVEIPNAKPIEYSLQYIFGIGHTTAKAILADTVRCSCCFLIGLPMACQCVILATRYRLVDHVAP